VGGALARILDRFRHWWERWKRPGPELATRASLTAALLSAAVLSLFGLLLSPSWPDTPYVSVGKDADRGTTPLRIGGTGGEENHYRGAIDEVRIYARTLTQGEIRKDMTTPVSAKDFQTSDGLVAAYGFDEAESTFAYDASGNENRGSLEGVRRVPDGRFGRALLFDGANDAVVIPNSPSLQLHTAYTLEAWVRPDRTQSDWPAVIEKEGDLYFLYVDSGSGHLVPAGGGVFGGSNEDVRPIRGLRPFRWSHLSVTYDGARLTIYLDGSPVARQVRWFAGRIHQSTLGGEVLPTGTVADPSRVIARLEEGLPIRLKGDLGVLLDEQAPVFKIENTEDIDVFLVAMEGSDLILRQATFGSVLGLPSPEIRIVDGAGPIEPGSAFEIVARGRVGRRFVAVNGISHGPFGFSLGMGWASVMHSQYLPGWLQASLTHAWVAIFAVPLGFWARPRWVLIATLPLVLGAVATLPVVLELSPTPPSEWAAIVVGFLAGIGVRFRVESRTRSREAALENG
jgi:hypothetical protein